MNFMLKYYVKNYDEECIRTFNSLDNLKRFIQYNNLIEKYSVYKINLFKLDLTNLL